MKERTTQSEVAPDAPGLAFSKRGDSRIGEIGELRLMLGHGFCWQACASCSPKFPTYNHTATESPKAKLGLSVVLFMMLGKKRRFGVFVER